MLSKKIIFKTETCPMSLTMSLIKNHRILANRPWKCTFWTGNITNSLRGVRVWRWPPCHYVTLPLSAQGGEGSRLIWTMSLIIPFFEGFSKFLSSRDNAKVIVTLENSSHGWRIQNLEPDWYVWYKDTRLR